MARLRGEAADLHGRQVDWGRRSVTFCDVTRPAIVLGSTQPVADVDDDAVGSAGVSIARRRSGGGAVLVEPGRVVWADVVVPAADPLWEADVGRAVWWLGEAWARALASLGVAGAGVSVHRGALVSSQWSSMICFAGLGPGEVCVGGAKVVGISQRRVRDGALFQCAVPLLWDPAVLAGLVVLDPASRATLEVEADTFACGLTDLVGATADQVEHAFVSHLPPKPRETA